MDIHLYNLLQILIKRNATLDQRSNRRLSPLSMAIKRNNVKAAMLLVQNGADVNIRDGIHTPLTLVHTALTKSDDASLKHELRQLLTLLLSKNANVNSCEDQLLWSPIMLTSSHYQDSTNLEHLQVLIQGF